MSALYSFLWLNHISLCVDETHSVYPSIGEGHFGYFHLLITVNGAAGDLCVHMFIFPLKILSPLKKNILFLAVLGLRCCTWAFFSAWPSPCGGFSHEAQALGSRASVVAAPGF